MKVKDSQSGRTEERHKGSNFFKNVVVLVIFNEMSVCKINYTKLASDWFECSLMWRILKVNTWIIKANRADGMHEVDFNGANI